MSDVIERLVIIAILAAWGGMWAYVLFIADRIIEASTETQRRLGREFFVRYQQTRAYRWSFKITCLVMIFGSAFLIYRVIRVWMGF